MSSSGPLCEQAGTLQNQLLVHGLYGDSFVDADGATLIETGQPTSGPHDVCLYQGVFYNTGVCCGRPLLQDGAPLLPPVVARAVTDWSGDALPWPLSDHDRARIGGFWLNAARMEHASVASFASFLLDLLRFGAPPELLAAAQRAAIEEVEHAVRCFDLASRALGFPVSPGPVAIHELRPADRLAFAEALVVEGCIGETLAALEAAARHSVAGDPDVLSALKVIQRDEASHAALAWRTLRWLLANDQDDAVRARVAATFANVGSRVAVREGSSNQIPSIDEYYGLLSAERRAHVLADGFARVIQPAWADLGGRDNR